MFFVGLFGAESERVGCAWRGSCRTGLRRKGTVFDGVPSFGSSLDSAGLPQCVSSELVLDPGRSVMDEEPEDDEDEPGDVSCE